MEVVLSQLLPVYMTTLHTDKNAAVLALFLARYCAYLCDLAPDGKGMLYICACSYVRAQN